MLLFEKKVSKVELVVEEVFQHTLKSVENETSQGLLFGVRRDKEGIMSSFGRKRCSEK